LEERFGEVLLKLRAKRKGKVGKIWFVDETYVRVKGKAICIALMKMAIWWM